MKPTLLIYFALASVAFAQNVRVTNPPSQPVPVAIQGEFTSPSTTSAPGATPSPSPAKAVAVQGIAGATAISTTSAANPSTTAATFTQGVKAVASAGTPLVLTGSGAVLVESVEIHARKNVTTANTGAIYIGFSSSGGSNYRVLLPGEVLGITAPSGKKLDLHLIYVDSATSADAVTWTALN